jgi:hypothetical protein
MNDRELLEFAAKAANIEIMFWSGCDVGAESPVVKPHGIDWNPLTDDGDALRLAVALKITVGPELPDVIGKSLCRVSWLNRSRSLGEYGDGCPHAATRRAIVRAAAEIEKDMK